MNQIISASKIEDIYKTLHRIGCLGDSPSAGFLRAAYSKEETQAMEFIEALAVQSEAEPRWDAVGNLFLEWPGETSEFVETASHIDTVPRGGNFDGAAGVVAGLVAIQAIKERMKRTKRGLRLRIWRGEESGTFNVLYTGSRGAFGILDEQFLSFKFRDQTLAEAMQSQGVDANVIRKKIRTISQDEADKIFAHVELHIEQGNQLEVGKTDIGIVTSIRSSKRYRIVLRGEFDHSGATPMGTEYRKDVNLAMAYLQVEVDKLCEGFRTNGSDLVQTFGVINSSRDFNEENPIIYTNAIPVISGYGYLTLDVRSNRKETLESCSLQIENMILQTAEKFGVKAEIQLLTSGSPLEELSPKIQTTMEEAGLALGLSTIRMPSGAGHDAAIVGAQTRSDGTTIPVGMLFIPCRGGKSHTHEEYASYEAIAKGASILALGLSEMLKSTKKYS